MNVMLSLALATVVGHAQLPEPNPSAIVGARSLALSPDGSRLAFSYRGDVWVVSSKGGRAVPVTNHVEMDDRPIWSPDGKWIAFASNRAGGSSIFLVPADGGEVRRLTYAPFSDAPSDWSADGKEILLRTNRETRENGIYGINVTTGAIKEYLLDFARIENPKYSSNGGGLVYQRMGFPFVRPRYEGSAAAQLWRFDITKGERIVIENNGFQHLWPGVGNDGTVYAVTVREKTPSTTVVGKTIPKISLSDNANRTPNVWAYGAGAPKRLTNFVGGSGARYLTVAKDASMIAFERDGDVYTMKPGGQAEKVRIVVSVDEKTTQEERLVLTNGVEAFSLTPKNDQLIFSVRGELWQVPVRKGKGPNADDATQLTDWAGVDTLPLVTPDGKAAFFISDRNGALRLFRIDLATKDVTPITTVDADVAELRLSPDKKLVSFWMLGSQGGIYTVPVGGGTPTRVLAYPGGSPNIDYDWSPDQRYIAFSKPIVGSGFYYWESASSIQVYDVATKESVNVTNLSVSNNTPRWSPDGKYLLFVSNRGGGNGIYALPLRGEDSRATELEVRYEKPTGPVKVDIDFDGIDRRARRLIAQPSEGDVQYDAATGEIWFQSEGDLWKASYSGEDLRRVTAGGGVGPWEFAQDGNTIVFGRGGIANLLNIRDPRFMVTPITFRADWTRDLRKERRAAFEQFWRAYNANFYDPNFHGRDWLEIRKRVEPLLSSVGHPSEFATILNQMVGELESSHSEVSSSSFVPGPSNAHLGFVIDPKFAGPGLRIAQVPERSPGSYAKTKLNVGEIVTKVNGKEVSFNEDLYRNVLNNQVGRDLTLTVQGADGKTREVKYRALSSGEFSGLLFENRLAARRAYVEKKSGGKLTYVHIAGMSQGELVRFNQQVWQFAQGKQGLIIDVRDNGGGNTADRIIDVLERQPTMIYAPRDEAFFKGPGQTLNMPMVVMHSESSFSNAEMFPAAMKARKLATLVGMPTPGYVIYTGGLPLVDGTNARMPGTGVWRIDGTPTENMGQQPDYKVDISPADYFAGRDPQLDKAIEVLLKQAK